MKKISKKEIQKIADKLKPFWNELKKLEENYLIKIRALENRMNKKVKAKTKMEFISCDGDFCGIGAENYLDRRWFPLIHDTELDK